MEKYKKYKNIIEQDYRFNASFRKCDILPKSFLNSYEWKTIVLYRKFQIFNDIKILRKLYGHKLNLLEKKTGIHFENNLSIGPGLIIGHWGKIGRAHV